VAAVPLAWAETAPGWQHESGDGGVNFAFYAGAQQELTIRCRGDAVEVVYYVDAATIDPALLGRLSAVLTVVIDDADEVQWIDSRLIAEPGVISIGVGGQPADDVARSIAMAERSVAVSILTGPPRSDSVAYNRALFPVTGAADAIKASYAACGIRF
jgi:hypothetical protein